MVHRHQAYTRRPAPGRAHGSFRPAHAGQAGPLAAHGPLGTTKDFMDKEPANIEKYGQFDVTIEQLGFTAGELANRIVDTVESYLAELVEKQTREGFRRELARYLATPAPKGQTFTNPAEDRFINDQMSTAFWGVGPQTPVSTQAGWRSADEWRVPPVPDIPDLTEATDSGQTPPRH